MVALQGENGPSRSSGNEGEAGVIEDANLELRQRLAAYRSLMLGNMTHDLRTPLSAILGFAEIMLAFEKLTEPQTQLCQRIQNSGRQLQSTINVLSDLIRLDFDETELSVRQFSPGDVLRESCNAVSRQAEKKGVSLSANIADNPGSVFSDEGKLRQSLYNFLAYAIARSPAGGEVTIQTSTTPNGDLLLQIDDQGAAVDVSAAFELHSPDSTVEDLNLRELGFDISQRLLNALGGRVTLQNREPQGLTILLLLPKQTQSLPGE
ncbi:MAG: HAMP domain-containing sensor histidine kinase [Pyrinomonadaceae bacterium]